MSLVLPSHRALNGLSALACFTAMGVALYLQYAANLEPCPLCIFQRVAMIATALVFALAFVHNPQSIGVRIYAALASLTALSGAGIAGRHVWLQHLPADEVPSCGPGLNYLIETLPFSRMLAIVLRGSGECAKIDWTFLGFTLPELTLAVFAGLVVIGLFQLVRRKHG
ncbi:MAG TPA: disulfide bond formation protein B [Pseudomonadales bacterium]|nr:disulfide bond formation protein B [Pseudomonadales bacterium]